MSAETIPAGARAWEYETQIFDGSWHSVVTREHPDALGNNYRALQPLIADRATRPAEPAAPVGDTADYVFPYEAWQVAGHFYETREEAHKEADRLDCWAEPKSPRRWVPAATLEAERARADAAEQRAAEALVRAEKAEDWQPIETAKAGELLLLFEPHSMGGFIFVGALNGVWFNNLDQKIQKPTMWRPLPAPPRASREAQPATDGDGNG